MSETRALELHECASLALSHAVISSCGSRLRAHSARCNLYWCRQPARRYAPVSACLRVQIRLRADGSASGSRRQRIVDLRFQRCLWGTLLYDGHRGRTAERMIGTCMCLMSATAVGQARSSSRALTGTQQGTSLPLPLPLRYQIDATRSRRIASFTTRTITVMVGVRS